MKAIMILILGVLTLSISQAQDTAVNHNTKYVMYAPNGSIAFVITDDVSKKTMRLEASENFYKYEVLDAKTATAVYSRKNSGKSCLIDKSFLGDGNYKIRLYNKNFIITSKITVLGFYGVNGTLRNQSLALSQKD